MQRTLKCTSMSRACRQKRLAEINFLCVDKRLRNKRLAPVLIREVTRRVHRRGMFQAVYTAGAYLPKPITTARCLYACLLTFDKERVCYYETPPVKFLLYLYLYLYFSCMQM